MPEWGEISLSVKPFTTIQHCNIVHVPFRLLVWETPTGRILNTTHSRFQNAQMSEWLNAMVAEVMEVFKFKRHICFISRLSKWAADFHPDATQSGHSVQSTFLLKIADVVGKARVFLSLFIQAKRSRTAHYDVLAARKIPLLFLNVKSSHIQWLSGHRSHGAIFKDQSFWL